MKKIALFIVAIALLAINVFSFAQYGGGGSTFVPSAPGSSSFALNRDNCPSGDFSVSFYDGTCGSLATNNNVNPDDVNGLLETGPEDDQGKVINVPANGTNNGTNGANNGTNGMNEETENQNTTTGIPSALPQTGVGY